MAQLMSVRLSRGDAPNWGFRLQGGVDFGTPLVIQKVNGGSPAERAGLIAGDSVIKINNTEVFNLRHKDAQDVIVRAGPSFEITVQRGGSTWRPSVTPVGSYPSSSPSINNVQTVTKTSLAAKNQSNIGAIGTGHNLAAKPFNSFNGTTNGTGPKLVNKQYNSPVGLYSEQSIAETLSAQTEVLSTGALGVNFKKNEKNYDSTNSAVFRMLQEAEGEPRDYEPGVEPDSGIVTSPNRGIAGLRHVAAPENKPQQPKPQLPPGQNICADCERLIVGVFVRIKDKNLHVECFKCATCGSSLKNVGYYNINNKLYCDIHAKLAAKNNAPGPNLVPVTVPPGGRIPAGTISAALSTHNLPTQSPLSPTSNPVSAPFSHEINTNGSIEKNNLNKPMTQELIKNLTIAAAAKKKEEEESIKNHSELLLTNSNNTNNDSLKSNYLIYTKPSPNLSGPRPFSSVSAPLSPPIYKPATAPLSPASSIPAPDKGRYVNILWPPKSDEPELPTASPLYFPPPSVVNFQPKTILHNDIEDQIIQEDNFDDEELQFMAQNSSPKMSLASIEVGNINGRRSTMECLETISESLQTQILVEGILKDRPKSPPPVNEDIVTTQLQQKTKQASVTDSCKTQSIICDKPCNSENPCETCPLRRPNVELKRPIDFQHSEKTTKGVENAVPKKWESPMVQALTTLPTTTNDTFAQIPTKQSRSAFASALAIAPREPFTPTMTTLDPVPLPEETEPYFPPEHPITVQIKPPKEEKPDSPFVKALQTAPDRSYTPIGGTGKKTKKQPDPLLQDLPKPEQPISMLAALTTASERSYSPLVCEMLTIKSTTESIQQPAKIQHPKPKPIDSNSTPKPFKPVVFESFEAFEEKERPPSTSFPPVTDELKAAYEYHADYSQIKSELSSQIIEQTQKEVHFEEESQQNLMVAQTSESVKAESENVCKCAMKSEKVLEKQEKNVIEKQSECTVMKKPLNLISCLHKAEALPQYQLNLDLAPIPMDFAQKKYPRQDLSSKEVSYNMHNNQNVQQQQQMMERQQIMKQQPLPTFNHGEPNPGLFKPVSDDRPPSTSFSPRPGSLTPSMINKPAPTIPYYQANLVATEYLAPEINLYDPKSPAISRSPSPCPGVERSSSPFRAKSPRAKSPAAGPPPNPLKQPHQVMEMFKESKELTQAKKSLQAFIPQHKEMMEHYAAQVSVQNKSYNQEQMQQYQQESSKQLQNMQTRAEGLHQEQIQTYQQEQLKKAEAERLQSSVTQVKGGVMTTNIAEKSQMEQLQQLNKQHSESIERSADNSIQIQRKKTVTEEYEHTHKEKTIEIQKDVTTTKTYPFQNTKGPALDPPTQRPHATCPQPLSKQRMACDNKSIMQNQGIVGLTVTCPQPLVSPFLGNQQQQQPLPKQQSINPQPCQASQVCSASHCCLLAQQKANPSQGINPPQQKNSYQQINAQPIQQPNNSIQQPNYPIQQPNNQIQQPNNSIQQPNNQLQQPNNVIQQPNNPSQQPNNPIHQPNNSIQQPYNPTQQSINQQCSSLNQKSVPSCNFKQSNVTPVTSSRQSTSRPNVPVPNTGAGGGRQAGAVGVAPRRGRGVLNVGGLVGSRIPLCGSCHQSIRGPFITALGKIWCPDHFTCATPSCRRPLQDLGFVEERGQLYCEYCFEQYLAPPCSKCNQKIKGDCLKAIGKNFHPECFNCSHCGKLFGNSPFFLEEGAPYCESDWNEMFTTKCFACGFPVEAGDRWVEALNNNYHSQCFNCTMCKKNLEGQSFVAKGGRPFCKNHAR